jgi:hypothetical protein
LQQRWSVNVNYGPHIARQIIALNLRAHIKKLTPRPDRQPLSAQERREQYEHAIDVCFNASVRPELKGKDLTQRQAWLANEARGRLLKIDETTCRRDLRDALDQIERQILASGYEPVGKDSAPDNSSDTSSPAGTAEFVLPDPAAPFPPHYGSTDRPVDPLFARRATICAAFSEHA